MKITGGDRSKGEQRVQAPPDEPHRSPQARAAGAKHGPAPAADRIEISGEARGLQAAHTEPATIVLETTQGAGERALDPARLDDIRAKIKSGYYDTAEITRSIAGRMLDLLGLKRSE